MAFWFRYGPAEHAELFHALPGIMEALSAHFDLYYLSLTSAEKPQVPASIANVARVIQFPIRISRRSNADKAFKTLLWISLTPLLAILCRIRGIRYVYVDETLPLVLPMGRAFFGRRMAMTLADLFAEQYLNRGAFRRGLGRLLFRLDLRAWRKAGILFTRSKSALDHLSRLGIPRHRMHYAYDAVDADLYHPCDRAACRREWGWQDSDIAMVFHGVLNPAKDLDLVLDALGVVAEGMPDFHFLIIGNGPDEQRLRGRVADRGLGSTVRFAGYRDPPEVARALGGADIGLVSRKADLGSQLVVTSVLGHCLACGIAVLASNTGAIAELVDDGENGLLYEPGNLADFTAQLQRLCGDASLRAALAAAGLQTVREKLALEETISRNTRPFLDSWIDPGGRPA